MWFPTDFRSLCYMFWQMFLDKYIRKANGKNKEASKAS